ncbi:MAG: hypothetical protein AAFU38_18510, partial [Bacteroidota bacterium]
PQGFSLERSGARGLPFVRALAAFLKAAVELRSGTGVLWRVSVYVGYTEGEPSSAAASGD